MYLHTSSGSRWYYHRRHNSRFVLLDNFNYYKRHTFLQTINVIFAKTKCMHFTIEVIQQLHQLCSGLYTSPHRDVCTGRLSFVRDGKTSTLVLFPLLCRLYQKKGQLSHILCSPITVLVNVDKYTFGTLLQITHIDLSEKQYHLYISTIQLI